LAKQELDTCKTNLAKLPRWKKAQKTLQDLDKKVIETQPIIDGFDGLMSELMP
jgi:hypothetical protein